METKNSQIKIVVEIIFLINGFLFLFLLSQILWLNKFILRVEHNSEKNNFDQY